jgi:hypothetical protein
MITEEIIKTRLNDIFIGCSVKETLLFSSDDKLYIDIYDLRTETIVITYLRIVIDNSKNICYITKDYPCVFNSKSFKDIGDISSFIKTTINKNIFGEYMSNINLILKHTDIILEIIPNKDFHICKDINLKYEISYNDRTIYLHISLNDKKVWFTSDISERGYKFEIHDFELLPEFIEKFYSNILKQI